MSDPSAALAALQSSYDASVRSIVVSADRARAIIDGSVDELLASVSLDQRPPLIADVPVDEPPPYVPPTLASHANALIPDTPLVESGGPPPIAFDDAPLWQS